MKRRYTGVLAALAAGVLIFGAGITGEAARTGTITTDGARVRASADANGERICSLPNDTIVDITDEAESGGRTWYQISFTLDGAEKTGWIRSDLLSVTETEDPVEETPTEETGAEEAPVAGDGYTIQEPSDAYEGAENMEVTTVSWGDESYTAYQADGETQLYLVWASKDGGNADWYWYDPAEETFQRDLGQFGMQGLVTSLQNELTELKSTSAKSLAQRLYIMIGLGVLSVILLILTIVFAVKSRNAGYDYYDEDEDDLDDSEDEEPDDDYEDDFEEEKPKKKRGLFRRRSRDEFEDDEEDEEEDDDFDEFVEAVNKKRTKKEVKDAYDDVVYAQVSRKQEETRSQDEEVTDKLPEIDMSALEGEEKPADKPKKETEEPAEEDDGLDIEILDLDDLNL